MPLESKIRHDHSAKISSNFQDASAPLLLKPTQRHRLKNWHLFSLYTTKVENSSCKNSNLRAVFHKVFFSCKDEIGDALLDYDTYGTSSKKKTSAYISCSTYSKTILRTMLLRPRSDGPSTTSEKAEEIRGLLHSNRRLTIRGIG